MREAIDLLARAGRNDLASDLNRIQARVDFDDLDVLRCVGTDRIADSILEAESFSELIALLGGLANAMNLSHVTLHVISEAASTNFSTKVLTTYPEAWISHYVDRRYFAVDPVARTCLATDHGFFWDRFDRTVPAARTFWEDAAMHGVGPAGYTRPIVTVRGDRLAVSVCSPLDLEAFRDRFERYEDDLSNLGMYLADSFCRLASAERPDTFNPTDDQLGILRALALGVTEEKLSQRSYQSGSYAVLEHSICTLFRTRTVVQAAILATRIGLLADAPLTKSDILAAPDVTAVGRLIVAPTGAPLRRLARLRTPCPDPAHSPAA
ncbi:autoinducer binding domain-containing protein [Amaricoccus sp.]|uniref:autoinducer binding domain-containing protein n=1 Tax=Amaricoccus sp. TaxID=1872485 RepID=UPI0025BBA1C6|nr:autoinducer binding domain-containing protein [Amaricoccus sp.]